MIKVVEINSAGKENIKLNDYEIVNVQSETNVEYDFNLLTTFYAKSIENRIKLLVKKYKILSIADEGIGSLRKIKTIVLVPTKKDIKLVIDSLTEERIFVDILKDEPQKEQTTPFKDKCKEWCDAIQNYLANEFDFSGTTKVKAVAVYKDNVSNILQIFDITVSGKGINNDIYNILKEIAKVITTMEYNVFFLMDKHEMFSFINSYFKS